jgi:WD40 repeat protein
MILISVNFRDAGLVVKRHIPKTVDHRSWKLDPLSRKVWNLILVVGATVFASTGHAATTFTNLVNSGNPIVSPGGPNSVTVVPQGEYATIDTKPIIAVVLKLKNTTGHENDDLISEIEQHSANYAPPVFFSLADLLYRQNDLSDAIFWYNAGRLRGDFDAARCADISARDAINMLVLYTPTELRKAQFADVDKLRSIVQKVIQWDTTTPYNYEYRWINLHGLNAMRSGLGQSEANSEPLSLPQSTWTDLEKKNRDDYSRSVDSDITVWKQRQAQSSAAAASTPAAHAGVSTIPDTPVNRMLGLTGPNQRVPRKEVINLGLGDNFRVKDLAFSPDGRYLAIFGNLDAISRWLVIWDVAAKHEIARMTDIGAGFETNPRLAILWAQDNSFVTLGMSFKDDPNNPASPWQMRLWNPLTGEKIRDVNVRAWYATLNRDGTELLTASGFTNHAEFRIYDTRTWAFREYPGNEILYGEGTLAWTAQNQVFAAGPWYGTPVLPDLQPNDILARVIDPSGQVSAQTLLLAPSKPAAVPTQGWVGTFDPRWSAVDEVGNKIAVGRGTIKVLSGDSLRVLYTYSPLDWAHLAAGRFVFSPDGKYLYILSDHAVAQTESVILDAETGRPIGRFPGGTAGLAVSPDGHWLAIGDGAFIKIFAVPKQPDHGMEQR